ncbi:MULTISPECIES: PhzF family phenazine biosynthesis protein [Aphanothece]|uniref:PhzF family phenazine biosynthesis protein n=1 Tax=Aphanothece TaxID=1121 RepID=UPI0039849A14
MSRAADPGLHPAVLVEAFASRPCEGNGAAVVLLDRPLEDGEMQALARSLNQSETAFLLPHGGQWLLRWFTPTCEVPLCGHGTLAAVLALGHWGRLAAGQPLTLHSRSGPLWAQLDAAVDGVAQIVLPSSGLIPAGPSPALEVFVQERLQSALEGYWTSPLGYTVGLLPADAALATAVLPSRDLPEADQGGLVLMQPLDPCTGPRVLDMPCRYQLRFLAPGLGIDEDPVTGSAHALVAPWWLERLALERVAGWQCSHRPGGMLCEHASSGMIRLCGSGHLLWDGTLHLDSRACGGESPGQPSPPGAIRAGCGWDGLLA